MLIVRKECKLVRPHKLALLSTSLFCNIPVVIRKLDLVFVFNQIVKRQFKKQSKTKS